MALQRKDDVQGWPALVEVGTAAALAVLAICTLACAAAAARFFRWE